MLSVPTAVHLLDRHLTTYVVENRDLVNYWHGESLCFITCDDVTTHSH